MVLLYNMHGDSRWGLRCRAGSLIPRVYYVYDLAILVMLIYGVLDAVGVWIAGLKQSSLAILISIGRQSYTTWISEYNIAVKLIVLLFYLLFDLRLFLLETPNAIS